MSQVLDLFRKYIHIPSASGEDRESKPSTPAQLEMAKALEQDLAAFGFSDVYHDGHAYVYARVPANCEGQPNIGLIAHLDVVSNEPCAPMNEKIFENYDGGVLDIGNGVTLDPEVYPTLKKWAGKTVITTDGTTILGADDKAGVAEIMAAGIRLLNDPSIKHGEVEICFTPDEEVGGGADDLDLERFGAEFAYTVDGGELGEIEFENFNASSAKVTFTGFAIHPGSAKNRMKNACRMAADFASLIPEYEAPEHTEGREGFFHLVSMQGSAEKCSLFYILRDHDAGKLARKEEYLRKTADMINFKYGGDVCEVGIREGYRNMIEVLRERPDIIVRAQNAFRNAGVEPVSLPIRGGTDGARLSFRGLPCPNLSTGGINAHGRLECACVTDMEKMVDVLIEIVKA
ncbi:MAG: peptidase T [Clostridiales bacterium]|nr:peptidase T [Clostridiales bacterium]